MKKLDIDEAVAVLLNKALKLDGFFPEFNAEHVRKLFPHSEFALHPKDSHVVRQGDEGRDVYIIASGAVNISRTMGNAGAHISTLAAGDIFGEVGLLRQGVRTATATVHEEARIFRLDHRDIQYLLKHNHELGDHLRHLVVKRAD